MVLNVGSNLFKREGGLSGEEVRVATIVVALDGSGDTDDVQEAINLLGAKGGVVYLREGVYITKKSITFSNNDISLIGAGRNSVIYTEENITVISILKDGITLNNLSIQGNNTGAQQIAVRINNSKKCFIKDCWLENLKGTTISIIGASEANQLTGNIITNGGTSGILVGVNNTTLKNTIISNNILQTIGLDGIKLGAVNASGLVIHTVITGNIILDAAGSGIITTTASGASIDQNVINNNQVHNCGEHGIILNDAGADRNLISNNIVLNNTTSQITNNGTNTLLVDNIIT